MTVVGLLSEHTLVLGRGNFRVILFEFFFEFLTILDFQICIFMGRDHSHVILCKKKVEHSHVIYLYMSLVGPSKISVYKKNSAVCVAIKRK